MRQAVVTTVAGMGVLQLLPWPPIFPSPGLSSLRPNSSQASLLESLALAPGLVGIGA